MNHKKLFKFCPLRFYKKVKLWSFYLYESDKLRKSKKHSDIGL